MDICDRCSEITPFLVMDILEAAQRMDREGGDVMHLEIGEPDFDAPDCVKEACCKAVMDNRTHYTSSLGIIELREAICEHYLATYGVEVHPDQVIITQGTSPGMLALFTSILEQGDKVVLSDPCYACYPNFIRFAGAEPDFVRVTEDDSFQYRVEAIEERLALDKDDRIKGVLINSPANPTGTLLDAERMAAIAALGRGNGPWIISDEIYHGLVYEGREHSILEFTDKAFVFNGFSKLYAMTGFRLGYVIAPKEYVRPLQRLCQNFYISANTMAQWAGVAALTEAHDDVARMKNVYDERRRFLIKRLKELGFGITHEPTGAFYVLADARHLGNDSLKLAFDILKKARVGVAPGIDFGAGAEGYLRFSYANSLENITEAMIRLGTYIDKR